MKHHRIVELIEEVERLLPVALEVGADRITSVNSQDKRLLEIKNELDECIHSLEGQLSLSAIDSWRVNIAKETISLISQEMS